jgi:hypothetical protein
MAVIRYFHEMIILIERARTYISGVFPLIFLETLSSVNDENKFYYVKELKALNRIWYGYMDSTFLRKIRDQCQILCRMDIMAIDLGDKYLCKELSRIKHSQYVAQRIITGTANGYYPNAANTHQIKFKPKFNSWKRKSNTDKDETLSNQTNVLSEEKEKFDAFANDINGMPEMEQN